MARNRIDALLALAVALPLLCCCNFRGGKAPAAQKPTEVSFPEVVAPAVLGSVPEKLDYVTQHFWDAFFELSGPVDSTRMLGVRNDNVERELANYISLLWNLELKPAQKRVSHFFSQLSEKQEKMPSAPLYSTLCQMVSRYLYDPNSPMRDEDLYLPFVSGMAESPLTAENMRAAYRYEASRCAICPRESIAPDFAIRTREGKNTSLHKVHAAYTILFFSNPGCHACADIIAELESDAAVQQGLKNGEVAVVNVYIDDDLEAWRQYAPNYPSTWVSGYDVRHQVRDGNIYEVRAIPSVYLLDSEKRILLKDAPVSRVLKGIFL